MEEETLQAASEPAAETAANGSFWDQLADFLSATPGDWLSWEVWTIATVVLLVAEVMTAGFVLAAFTPGTVLAALLAAIGASMFYFILYILVKRIARHDLKRQRAREIARLRIAD